MKHALLQVQPLPAVTENMRINRRRVNDAPENDRRGLRGVLARGRGGYGGERGRHRAPVDFVILDGRWQVYLPVQMRNETTAATITFSSHSQ